MPRPSISSILTQMYPPKPGFTDKDLSNLNGKVYIVTGANTGIGKELARILYSKNAKVYIGARSEEKANKAIEEIKKATPGSKGKLVFLQLDLNDLTKVKTSAQEFLSLETKLHVLFNNAGIMGPPPGSKTVQGYEQHLGVNNVGTFLFTKLLTPLLVATAKTEAPNTVRVIWLASSAAELLTPADGVPLDNLDYHKEQNATYKYGVSKAGNYLHAVEFAKRYRADGIISVALNPGNLHTELLRTQGTFRQLIIRYLLQYPPVYGAYVELFAGMSPKVTIENSGIWIVPWGRFLPLRKDLVEATKTKAEGGTGIGLKFWEWTEEQVKPFV